MSYTVIWTSRFKKDYKLLMKQGADMSLRGTFRSGVRRCDCIIQQEALNLTSKTQKQQTISNFYRFYNREN